MEHITTATRSAYFDGRLSKSQAVEFQEHIIACEACFLKVSESRLQDDRSNARSLDWQEQSYWEKMKDIILSNIDREIPQQRNWKERLKQSVETLVHSLGNLVSEGAQTMTETMEVAADSALLWRVAPVAEGSVQIVLGRKLERTRSVVVGTHPTVFVCVPDSTEVITTREGKVFVHVKDWPTDREPPVAYLQPLFGDDEQVKQPEKPENPGKGPIIVFTEVPSAEYLLILEPKE